MARDRVEPRLNQLNGVGRQWPAPNFLTLVCVMFDCRPRTKKCPHCGQILVPDGLALPPVKRRILDAVKRRPGITAEDLRALVWADDPNGGPENRKAIH